MNRKLITGGAAAALITLLAACGTDTGDAESSSATTSTSAQATNPATKSRPASLPQTASDGLFEFTVLSVTKDDNGKIGEPILGVEAQGSFWVVTLDVKNVGESEGQFIAQNQKLHVGKKTYEVSDKSVLLGKKWPVIEDVNPDNELSQVFLLFDLPKKAKPDAVELHDSAFSEGTTIRIS